MGEALLVRRGGALDEAGIFIEPGLIVEWFGLASNVPEGWQLCDGSNDTPNLIDQFIVGAGSTYSVGNTGGSANAVVVSHTHTITTNTFSHNHTYPVGAGSSGAGIGQSTVTFTGSFNSGGGGSHSHTVTTTASGESNTDKNLPPYFSLFYIMKMEE